MTTSARAAAQVLGLIAEVQSFAPSTAAALTHAFLEYMRLAQDDLRSALDSLEEAIGRLAEYDAAFEKGTAAIKETAAAIQREKKTRVIFTTPANEPR